MVKDSVQFHCSWKEVNSLQFCCLLQFPKCMPTIILYMIHCIKVLQALRASVLKVRFFLNFYEQTYSIICLKNHEYRAVYKKYWSIICFVVQWRNVGWALSETCFWGPLYTIVNTFEIGRHFEMTSKNRWHCLPQANILILCQEIN